MYVYMEIHIYVRILLEQLFSNVFFLLQLSPHRVLVSYLRLPYFRKKEIV